MSEGVQTKDKQRGGAGTTSAKDNKDKEEEKDNAIQRKQKTIDGEQKNNTIIKVKARGINSII